MAAEGTRETTMRPWGGAIYIFGGAEGHGLSRGNGIFEARRSRKAIIPKAVLIKAQPRYIAAMPHTPICPPPPRTSPYPRRSYRPFFCNPPQQPLSFRDDRVSAYSLLPPPPVTTFLFFSLYRSSIREYFFPGFLPPHSLSLPPSHPLSRARMQSYQIAGALALRGRYFSTDPLHYFNERDPIARRDPFRSRISTWDDSAAMVTQSRQL